jgi:hypothetical protein
VNPVPGTDAAEVAGEDAVILAARWRPKPQVIVRQVGDWSMLIDVASGFTYEANRVGTQVWQLLGESVSLHGACVEVARTHQVAVADVVSDVLGFARDLIRFGLLVADPAAPSPAHAGRQP